MYGLIGIPLTHSFSPAYFKNKFATGHIDASYELFPLTNISEFQSLLYAHPQLAGLNVTIPYKRSVIGYLDEMDAAALEINAVNCISFNNGKKKGYNTDIIGFERSLLPILKPHHTHALVLGTGGSSLAVTYVLRKAGISFQKIARIKTVDVLSYEELTPEIINQYTLIINTTPLGMYPEIDNAPSFPYEHIGSRHLLYDLIYNPEQTKFLSLGKAQGATIKNGLEMLHLQAEASWQIWNS